MLWKIVIGEKPSYLLVIADDSLMLVSYSLIIVNVMFTLYNGLLRLFNDLLRLIYYLLILILLKHTQMKKHTTNCAYCGQEFTGKTRKAMYCSASCRVMAARKRVEQRISEKRQYKSYFEAENQKLQDKKNKLFQEQIQFDIEKEDFQTAYNKFMPQIMAFGNLKGRNEILEKDLELTEKECKRLKGLLIKNGVDPLSA